MTIENKRKSSIWKSSETIQTEPKERWGVPYCCTELGLLHHFHHGPRPPPPPPPPGPGPGRYALPPTVGYINHDFTKPSSPAYSFHSRMSSAMVSVDSSPGPRYHIDAKLTRFGRMETPSYSMLGRGRSTGDNKASKYRSVDPVPAPNSYRLPNLLGSQVPNKPSSASYSFSGRRKVGAPSEDLSKSPGPAKYDTTNPDIYHQRQPSFSMQKRTKRPSYSSAIPGPGTYSPEKFHVHLPKPPSFSMGVRHSEFVTPLVVEVID
ncbi:hypothetical protein KUCAC02_026374 [Chaenocephalus aceratus]|uniref:Uncharacterized protein n=1 Tax=Chaenocephalus aceratus TaxID=36190 RepID=A0ACB9VY33_CHAAC|nr:hypothetical protein KUCAC02_026374 [Chaenocephalus aceratus]